MTDKLQRPILISFDERKGTVEVSDRTNEKETTVFDCYTLRAEYDLNGNMDIIRLCKVEELNDFLYLVFETDSNNEVYSGTAEFYSDCRDACRKYVGLIGSSLYKEG